MTVKLCVPASGFTQVGDPDVADAATADTAATTTRAAPPAIVRVKLDAARGFLAARFLDLSIVE